MLYKRSLENLREIQKNIPCDFYMNLKIENIFKEIRLKDQKKRNSKTFLFIYIIHFYLSLITFFNILFLKFVKKNIVVGHYLINVKNNESQYDFRSKFVLDLINPDNSINFFHNGDIYFAFKNSFRVKNAIYFESLLFFYNFFQKKNYLSDIKQIWFAQGKIAKREENFLVKLLEILNIKKFIFLDDSRHALVLLSSCKRLNIQNLAYQHARFNKYHLGLGEIKFDYYLVWNDYFKNLLTKMNSDYKDESVFACSHPRIINKKIKNSTKNNSILIVEESFFDLKIATKFINIIPNNFEVFYRSKPGSKKKKDIVMSRNIHILKNKPFEEDIVNISPLLLIGSESSLLIESWLYNVPSLGIKTINDYADHLVEDNLVEFCENTEDFLNLFKKLINLSDEEISKKRIKLWGNSSLNTYKEILSNKNFL